MFLDTKEVSKVFKESVKCVSRKFQKTVFQLCFNEVLFFNFVVAMILFRLPEQKDCLLKCHIGKAQDVTE